MKSSSEESQIIVAAARIDLDLIIVFGVFTEGLMSFGIFKSILL